MKKAISIMGVVLVASLAAALLRVQHVANKPALTIQQPKSVAAPAAQQPTVAPVTHPPPPVTTDALRLVTTALPAAKAGDGRAAYKIARVLDTCAWELSAPDPEARLQQSLHPNMPPWLRDMRESRLQWCIGLVKAPPFGDLPATSEYWMAQAYAAGDPLAQEDKAAAAASTLAADVGHNLSATERAEKMKIVQDNLRAAVESGDLEALFQAGRLLTHPYLVTDPMPGYAVALAACDLGRDCTAANPQSEFYACAQQGLCPGREDFPTILQRDMSTEQYAKLYARSQQIVLDMRAGNYDAVLANLTITK